jgi:hypothetical protein
VASKLKNKSQRGTVIHNLKENLKLMLKNKYNESEIIDMQTTMTEAKFLAWVYSKSQGMELATILNSMTNANVRNQLCEDFYLYANSQSSISAPYYKLE